MKRTLTIVTPLAVLISPALAQEDAGPDTRGLVVHTEGAFDGYTLIAPLTSKSILLLDMEGEIAHRWDLEETTECAILLDRGNLLRWGIAPGDNPRFKGPGVDGGIVDEIDWDGNVVWRYTLDDDYQLLHHDIALLPNGNVLFLAWEHRFREDAIEWGRDPAHVGEDGIWPDAVFEIRPTPPEGAEIVWEWHSWDHIVQDHDSTKRNYGSVPRTPGKIDINADHRDRPPMTPEELAEQKKIEREMAELGYGGADEEDEEDDRTGAGVADAGRRSTAPDWLHTNAVDYNAELDLIVLSSPALCELWVIDHSTTTEEAARSAGGRWGKGGDLLWRWGNPRNYGAGTDADQKLFYQHDPTWLASATGELRLLVFNNGRGRSDGSYSSVDELVLPFDPEKGFLREPGKAFGPEGPVWSYSEPGQLFSSFISGTQRLPNGNTLICSGAQGRVLEVTPDQRVVWDFRSPHGGESDLFGIPTNSLYRAVRIARDHPGLKGRDLGTRPR